MKQYTYRLIVTTLQQRKCEHFVRKAESFNKLIDKFFSGRAPKVGILALT